MVVLVVVVDSKHNSSNVSFQMNEKEIVVEETIRWKTPTPNLTVRKAPILAALQQEGIKKELQNHSYTKKNGSMTGKYD